MKLKSNLTPALLSLVCLAPLCSHATTSNGKSSSGTKNAAIAAGNERVQQRLKAIRDVKSATLIFTKPFETEPPMSEGDFVNRGCSFDINNADQISEIIEIINTAHVRFNENSFANVAFLNGIILRSGNGEEQKFFFDYRDYKDKTIHGLFNNQSVTADVQLIKKLYSIELKTKIATRCNKFIEYYKDQ